MPFCFDDTYANLPERFYARVTPTPVKSPKLLAFNEALAENLHLSRQDISTEAGLAIFAGNLVPAGAQPIALAYAGHQFGHLSPQLGDGRAILLGEIVGCDARRYDVQLKGAGRTVFSRGGDGRAAIGPVLREYLLSETMFALGVPTTRALCAVATGETINRDGPMPGAVLTRVALSHLRVGTFEYFAIRKDIDALAHLVNYALNRLYPQHSGAESGALVLLDAVIAAQAELLAQWMGLGFVHGVMNTDNTAISGQTLDYGPCAFLDTFKEDRVFSSIDRQGRYAFANQANCALWNMERLADALQPLLVHELGDTAKLRTLLSECLESFAERFQSAYLRILRNKLGLASDLADDSQLASVFLRLMSNQSIDYTLCFRQLTELSAAGDDATFLSMFENHDPIKNWLQLWRQRCALDTLKSEDRAARMRAINPAFIPRNHRVEEALAAAARGDMTAFERLLKVLSRPYEDQAEAIDLATPPGPEQWQYKTFCGT